MPELELLCGDCGGTFPYTEEEQEFFQAKGFEPPKRCKPCRDKRKQDRGGGRREMHEAVCAACGITTTIPFKPVEDRPVYCRDCYQDVNK